MLTTMILTTLLSLDLEFSYSPPLIFQIDDNTAVVQACLDRPRMYRPPRPDIEFTSGDKKILMYYVPCLRV